MVNLAFVGTNFQLEKLDICVLLVLQDAGMNYTGTIYETTMQGGFPAITGAAAFVSAALSPQPAAVATYGNAGGYDTHGMGVTQ